MIWKPHVTVAAVIESEQRFLLVEEQVSSGIAFNQPAGHLDEAETLIDAVKREVMEETAWKFEPEQIISIQLWRKDSQADSFLRVCFSGKAHSHNPTQSLDKGIIQIHWLTRDEVAAKTALLRSPLVLESIDDYIKGDFYPLSLLKSSLDL